MLNTLQPVLREGLLSFELLVALFTVISTSQPMFPIQMSSHVVIVSGYVITQGAGEFPNISLQ